MFVKRVPFLIARKARNSCYFAHGRNINRKVLSLVVKLSFEKRFLWFLFWQALLLIWFLQGTPQLICGHHVVTGKIQKLDKPYAVMKKNNILHEINESMEIDDSDGQSTAYDIVAFVKQKIIFKNRPKPIIIKTQPTKTWRCKSVLKLWFDETMLLTIQCVVLFGIFQLYQRNWSFRWTMYTRDSRIQLLRTLLFNNGKIKEWMPKITIANYVSVHKIRNWYKKSNNLCNF